MDISTYFLLAFIAISVIACIVFAFKYMTLHETSLTDNNKLHLRSIKVYGQDFKFKDKFIDIDGKDIKYWYIGSMRDNPEAYEKAKQTYGPSFQIIDNKKFNRVQTIWIELLDGTIFDMTMSIKNYRYLKKIAGDKQKRNLTITDYAMLIFPYIFFGAIILNFAYFVIGIILYYFFHIDILKWFY